MTLREPSLPFFIHKNLLTRFDVASCKVASLQELHLLELARDAVENYPLCLI